MNPVKHFPSVWRSAEQICIAESVLLKIFTRIKWCIPTDPLNCRAIIGDYEGSIKSRFWHTKPWQKNWHQSFSCSARFSKEEKLWCHKLTLKSSEITHAPGLLASSTIIINKYMTRQSYQRRYTYYIMAIVDFLVHKKTSYKLIIKWYLWLLFTSQPPACIIALNGTNAMILSYYI